MNKLLITLALSFVSVAAFSQDTLKVMHYNLLNYGNITSYCTATNNYLLDKEQYLKTIIKYVKPDILSVNEISNSTFIHQRLLDTCLNNDGVTKYAKSTYVNSTGSDLVVMLYYNKEKLAIAKQQVLASVTRDIILYKLYYKSPTLATLHDTAFINVIGAHFKAGSTTADEQSRAQETAAAMLWLTQNAQPGDYLFLGDFNVYSSSEQAFQNLINYSNTNYRFYDPVNKIGSWNGNSSYEAYHTQSTHTTSNGCASTGGMDDRFDFILASSSVINGTNKYKYISGSYTTVGNDGNHFNTALNNGTNNSVPANVLTALYNMSDHLPVTIKLKVNQQGASINEIDFSSMVQISNPVLDELFLRQLSDEFVGAQYNIIGMEGKIYTSGKIGFNSTETINISALAPGFYIFQLKSDGGNMANKKFIKI